MNHPQTNQFLNETIIENIFFIHIKILSVEQHLQLRESETLELNQQVFHNLISMFLGFFLDFGGSKVKIGFESILLIVLEGKSGHRTKQIEKKKSRKRKFGFG